MSMQPPAGLPRDGRTNGQKCRRHVEDCQGKDLPIRHVPTTSTSSASCCGRTLEQLSPADRLFVTRRVRGFRFTFRLSLRLPAEDGLHAQPTPTTRPRVRVRLRASSAVRHTDNPGVRPMHSVFTSQPTVTTRGMASDPGEQWFSCA